MIFEGSRYEYAPLARVMTASGEVAPALFHDNEVLRVRRSFSEYTWRGADRIDLVAQKFLGDPEKWWRIMAANPQILDPDEIEAGTVIRIPSA